MTDNLSVSQQGQKRSKEMQRNINKLEVVSVLNEMDMDPGLKAIMFGNIDVETGGSFDINQVEKLEPGTTRDPGIGLFQKTGKTLRDYRKYLKRTDKPHSIRSEIEYYTDSIKNPNSPSGVYLGSGYMQDYQQMLSGRKSELREHKGSGITKQYDPTFEGVHEHFVNFMMNPKEEARKETMQKRYDASVDAYRRFFKPSGFGVTKISDK